MEYRQAAARKLVTLDISNGIPVHNQQFIPQQILPGDGLPVCKATQRNVARASGQQKGLLRAIEPGVCSSGP